MCESIYNTETLSEAFSVLGQIEQVSSLNSKQELLKSTDNPILKTILYLTYNNFIQFYIRKIPKITPAGNHSDISHYLQFLQTLVKLKERDVTGNAAIELVVDTLSGCSEEEFKWFSRVIRRDLKVGLAEKGINKAYPKLVPIYDTMLAEKLDQSDLNLNTPGAMKMLPDDFVIQYKIDGYRLNIHVEGDNNVFLTTRNGKPVFGYTQLEEEAKKLPAGYVYDGEMVSVDLFDWIRSNMQNDETIPNRDLFSEAMSHAFSHEKNKKGIFNLYDMVPVSEWNSRYTTESLGTRYDRIHETIIDKDFESISVVPTSRVYHKNNPNDLTEVVDLFHKFLSYGWEGAMIKDYNAVYTFDRSKAMIKMKLMDTIDLVVTDIYEGEPHTKYVGMMGGVYVDYKGYQLGVGSGWSDEERQYYWENPNEIIGKTLEIAYQAETSNKQGGLSLSFPVKKKVRDDK